MATITLPENELTEFDLPRVCIVTGATEGVVFKDVKFQWYPRWIVALVVINVLIAAIVAFAMTKKVKGKLPFTEAAYAAWRRGVWLNVLGILGAIVLLVVGMVAFGAEASVLGVLALVAMVALPFTTYFTAVKGKVITCTRIADGKVDLKIPNDQVALQFRQHLHAGAVAPGLAAPGA